MSDKKVPINDGYQPRLIKGYQPKPGTTVGGGATGGYQPAQSPKGTGGQTPSPPPKKP